MNTTRKDLKCPYCGLDDLTRIFNYEYLCNNCNTDFVHPPELVNFLYNRLEHDLRSQTKVAGNVDSTEIIDMAFDQGIINSEEKKTLHELQMSRNILVHENKANLLSDLIFKANKIHKHITIG